MGLTEGYLEFGLLQLLPHHMFPGLGCLESCRGHARFLVSTVVVMHAGNPKC